LRSLTAALHPVELKQVPSLARRPFFRPCFPRTSVAGGLILKLLVLLFIVLLVFSNRLPSVARSLGQTVSEFKKGYKELDEPTDDDSRQS
jgi:TatA/E family protein of Tat protein translocase